MERKKGDHKVKFFPVRQFTDITYLEPQIRLREIFRGEVNHVPGQVNTKYRALTNLYGYFCGDLPVPTPYVKDLLSSF